MNSHARFGWRLTIILTLWAILTLGASSQRLEGQTTAVWTGPGAGGWGYVWDADPGLGVDWRSHWNISPYYPTAGTPAGDDWYNVVINGAVVSIDGTYDIQGLTLGSGGGITFDSHTTDLIVRDDITNDGTITFAHDLAGVANASTLLRIGADVAIGGTGLIEFVTDVDGSIYKSGIATALGASDSVLTIGAGQTIRTTVPGASGWIFCNTVLNGVVEADNGRIRLRYDHTNNNAMRALNGGTLILNSGATVDNTNGMINVDPTSTMTVENSVTIRGGTIDGGGTLLIQSSVFNPSLLDAAAGMTLDGVTVRLEDSATLHLAGTVTNNATFELSAPSGYHAGVKIDGDVTLDGTGAIHFVSTGGENYIWSVTPTDTLTLTAGQSVATTGGGTSGAIYARTINRGTIDANGGRISFTVEDIFNNNLMRARNGGTLYVGPILLDNTDGTITIDPTSTFELGNNATIRGGTIDGSGTLLVSSSTHHPSLLDAPSGLTLDDVTVRVEDSELHLAGTVTNNATFEMNDTVAGGEHAAVRIDGDVTIDGTGAFHFVSTVGNNYIWSVNASDTLTLGAGQTVATTGGGTYGAIYARTINRGTIDANGGRISFTVEDIFNNNLMRARNGGTLYVGPILLDNTDGTITIDPTSTFELGNNATIRGGTIDGSGTLLVSSSTHHPSLLDGTAGMTLDDVTVLVENSELHLSGNPTNNATFEMNDTAAGGEHAAVRIDGDVTIDGTGAFHFVSTVGNNYIWSVNPTDTLTLGAGQTVATTGTGTNGSIYARTINHGTIDANGGWINFTVEDIFNNNLMRARNGGKLHVGPILLDNTGGTITIDPTSTVELGNNTTIRGGIINGGGTIHDNGSDSRLEGNGMIIDNVTIEVDQDLTLAGTFTNNGTILMNNPTTSNPWMLRIDGDVVLNGNGSLRFPVVGTNTIRETTADASLTIGPEQTLAVESAVTGTVLTDLIIQGRVQADGVLSVRSTGGLVVESTGEMTGSGTIYMDGLQLVNHGTAAPGNSTGTLEISTGTYVQASDGTLAIEIGGNVVGDEYDQLLVDGAELDGDLRVELVDLGDGLYLPGFGETFTIVEGTGITGTFSAEHVSSYVGDEVYTWDVLYDSTYVMLEVGAVLLASDFDEDGDVDGDDFLTWQSGFGTATGATHLDGDSDGDGDVDGDDFLKWQSQFGSSGGSGATTAAPEPTSACIGMLLLLAAAAVPRRWR